MILSTGSAGEITSTYLDKPESEGVSQGTQYSPTHSRSDLSKMSGGGAAAAAAPPAQCQDVAEQHVRTMAQMFILTIVFLLTSYSASDKFALT